MQFDLALENDMISNWVTRKGCSTKKINSDANQFRIVDLFCGCGGLTDGLVEALLANGFNPEVVLAIDNNESALSVYRSNFEKYSKSILNADIDQLFRYDRSKKEFNISNYVDNIAGIDVLVAGPPCQGNSDLNNISRRDDPRNSLYLTTVKAVQFLKPKLVLIENVPAVIHSKQNVIETSINSLRKLGYQTKELRVPFVKLGLAQTRIRHILLASNEVGFIENICINGERSSLPILKNFISDIEDHISDRNILLKPGVLSKTNLKRVRYLFQKDIYDLPNHKRPACHKLKPHSYISNYGRLDYNKPAQTITSGFGSMGQGRYIHPTQERTITAREAARIQGFPDDFKFDMVSTVTELRKMIANAVPPQLSFSIMTNYLKYLKNK